MAQSLPIKIFVHGIDFVLFKLDMFLMKYPQSLEYIMNTQSDFLTEWIQQNSFTSASIPKQKKLFKGRGIMQREIIPVPTKVLKTMLKGGTDLSFKNSPEHRIHVRYPGEPSSVEVKSSSGKNLAIPIKGTGRNPDGRGMYASPNLLETAPHLKAFTTAKNRKFLGFKNWDGSWTPYYTLKEKVHIKKRIDVRQIIGKMDPKIRKQVKKEIRQMLFQG